MTTQGTRLRGSQSRIENSCPILNRTSAVVMRLIQAAAHNAACLACLRDAVGT